MNLIATIQQSIAKYDTHDTALKNQVDEYDPSMNDMAVYVDMNPMNFSFAHSAARYQASDDIELATTQAG